MFPTLCYHTMLYYMWCLGGYKGLWGWFQWMQGGCFGVTHSIGKIEIVFWCFFEHPKVPRLPVGLGLYRGTLSVLLTVNKTACI
jgi:hypothetical protein